MWTQLYALSFSCYLFCYRSLLTNFFIISWSSVNLHGIFHKHKKIIFSNQPFFMKQEI